MPLAAARGGAVQHAGPTLPPHTDVYLQPPTARASLAGAQAQLARLLSPSSATLRSPRDGAAAPVPISVRCANGASSSAGGATADGIRTSPSAQCQEHSAADD